MLRRPTAVKLLDINKVSGTMVARFGREVQPVDQRAERSRNVHRHL